MSSSKEKKIVAVDYKGKHFILADEDRVDEMDYVDEDIDVRHVIEKNLENHVADCHYYGIPAYYGDNEELKEKIKKIEDLINKTP